jgi:hypothetical protein
MGKFHSVVVDSRFKKRDLESGVDALKVMAAYIGGEGEGSAGEGVVCATGFAGEVEGGRWR